MTSGGVKKQQAKIPNFLDLFHMHYCLQVLLTVSSLPLVLAHNFRSVVRLAIRGFYYLTALFHK
jgi:hypothetical protein